MILFIKLPTTGHKRLLTRLIEWLGADAVGWLGRNVTAREIRDGLKGKSFSILCGPIDIGAAFALDHVDLVATMLPATPHLTPLAEWNHVRQNAKHRHHAIAHTLFLDEVIGEGHPLGRQITNIATRHLTPRDQKPSAERALATIERLPFLAGVSSDRKAFAEALAGALDLPAGALEPGLFTVASPPEPDPATLKTLRRISNQDRILTNAVKDRIGTSGVYRSQTPAAAG